MYSEIRDSESIMLRFLKGNTKPSINQFEKEDLIPNSQHPFLHWRSALEMESFSSTKHSSLVRELEVHVASRGWRAWVNEARIYGRTYYRSTAHEVVVVLQGHAALRIGGPAGGKSIRAWRGDILAIPAGVARRLIKGEERFTCVGFTPVDQIPDRCERNPEDYQRALKNLLELSLPQTDPLFKDDQLLQYWT